MKDSLTSFIAWVILEFIVYLIFAFVSADFNFTQWHEVWRLLYAICFTIIAGVAINKFSK
jgi:hypothetical protein